MIGRIDPSSRDVTIIGAGFAGLLAGYRLLKAGYQVTIHEKSDRCGGLIDTTVTPYGIVERAAHSIRSAPAMLELLSDLNVDIVRAKTSRKFIARGGRLRKNPLTLWEMFTAGCYANFKKSDGIAQTLAEWGNAHVGPGAVDAAFTPLCHGIYAAEPEDIDQQLAFPRLSIPAGQTFVQKMFSAKKSGKSTEKSFVLSPRGGMFSLITALRDFIDAHPDGNIMYNSTVTSLPDYTNIVITAPAPVTGKLIGSERLANINYAPMVVVNFFIDAQKIKLPNAIGFLNARGDDTNTLGILFNSRTFDGRAKDGYVSLSVMMGGYRHDDLLQKTDDEIVAIAASDLRQKLGFRDGIAEAVVTRWPHALPLYSAELRETLEDVKNGWAAQHGHVLFGNFTGEISLRGMVETSLSLGK